LHAPIALIIFNRPDTTEKVFAEISKAKPKKLFIIADGPRNNDPYEVEKCNATRAVIERVDWDCEVFKKYSEVNLGCGLGPASGISWVFEHVEEAIILEDDCIPSQTFFRYCSELLERYKHDERIMTISGMKLDFGQKQNSYSYSFRLMPHCWGWATWRRAWQHYDFKVRLWPELRDSTWLLDITEYPGAAEFYKGRFDIAFNCKGAIDYWDYQWLFACWSQKGYSISPHKNLIVNIGFGAHATHTNSLESHQNFANFELEEMDFPLRHPPHLVVDRQAHLLRFKRRFPEKEISPSWYQRIYRKFYNFLRSVR
jgi:hypothetical protein